MSYLLIILSAFLLNTANYFPSLYLFSWIGFLPLFFVFEQSLDSRQKLRLSSRKKDIISLIFDLKSYISNNRIFFKGWVFGLVYTALSAKFLYHSIYLYTNLNFFIIFFGLFVLFSLLALPYAVFFKLYFTVFGEVKALYFSAAWLVFTFLRYKLLYFFPIGYLAEAQAEFLHFIQLADLGGIWLLTFFLLFFNVLLYQILFKKKNRFIYITIVLMLALLIFSYGEYSLVKYQSPSPQEISNRQQSSKNNRAEQKTILPNFLTQYITPAVNQEAELGLITTDIPQQEKWRSDNVSRNIEITLAAAEELEGSRAVFAPETNITFDITQSSRRKDFLQQIGDRFDVPLQIGSMAVREDGGGKYNSSFLISSAEIEGRYDKNRLVFFGEIFPFADILTELTFNNYSFNSLKAGDQLKIFRAENLSWKTVICSEILYTDLAAEKIGEADFIVNQTNEGWYRKDRVLNNMMWNNAVLRAVETRRSVLKVGNQAYDGLVYPSGNYIKTAENQLYHNLPADLNAQFTFYSSYYNYIEWFLIFLSTIFIIFTFLKIYLTKL
ncbi:MAG: apolipoprotein N-acyltransferase [Halanaerobium sp.]